MDHQNYKRSLGQNLEKMAKSPSKDDGTNFKNNDLVAKNDEIKYRGVKAMPFIIGNNFICDIHILKFRYCYSHGKYYIKHANFAGNETFEKLGTVGTLSNLLVYLTTVFNMSTISATNLINVFNGTCNFGTLIGAFFSDTYFGRYKTLGFASVSSVLVQFQVQPSVFFLLHPFCLFFSF